MSLMKTRNPSKSHTTCPTMNKIVHFPGISHAFPRISHAQIPGSSQVCTLCHQRACQVGGSKASKICKVDEEIGFMWKFEIIDIDSLYL